MIIDGIEVKRNIRNKALTERYIRTILAEIRSVRSKVKSVYSVEASKSKSSDSFYARFFIYDQPSYNISVRTHYRVSEHANFHKAFYLFRYENLGKLSEDIEMSLRAYVKSNR